jgi:hypothetical protein
MARALRSDRKMSSQCEGLGALVYARLSASSAHKVRTSYRSRAGRVRAAVVLLAASYGIAVVINHRSAPTAEPRYPVAPSAVIVTKPDMPTSDVPKTETTTPVVIEAVPLIVPHTAPFATSTSTRAL